MVAQIPNRKHYYYDCNIFCCRVRTDYNGGAWCPKNQITTEPREWIEINLHFVHVITATGVQGRFGNGQGAEFTEAYLIDYWRPKLGKWVRYKDAKGNEVSRILENTFNAFLGTKISPLNEKGS